MWQRDPEGGPAIRRRQDDDPSSLPGHDFARQCKAQPIAAPAGLVVTGVKPVEHPVDLSRSDPGPVSVTSMTASRP